MPLLLIVSTLIFTTAKAAGVNNISGEQFKQINKNAFWVVNVSCDDSNNDRVVLRNADTDTWCPEGGSTSLCSDDKSLAAKNACSDAYQTEITALAKKEAAQRIKEQEIKQQQRQQAALTAAQEKEALENKIFIEEELLSIEQKRLDLQQKELQINRRISEIEKILETENDDEEDGI